MKRVFGTALVLLVGFGFLLYGTHRLSSSGLSGAPSVAAAAPTLAGGEEEEETGEGGGTLTSAILTDPIRIDPQAEPNPGLNALLPYLFDTLLVRDANNALAPSLAQGWQVSPDGRTITLQLKPEVYFQDGTVLNAQAVQSTLERFRAFGAESPIYDGILQIAGIDAVDDRTVRLEIDGSATEVLSALASPYAGIFSPESAKRMEQGVTDHLVGTGPFVLGDWQPGQSVLLQRYLSYHWGPATNQNRDRVFIANVVFQVIPDPRAQVKALKDGQVRAIYVADAEQWRELQSDPAVRLIPAPKVEANATSSVPAYIISQGLALAPTVEGAKLAPTGQMLLNDVKLSDAPDD